MPKVLITGKLSLEGRALLEGQKSLAVQYSPGLKGQALNEAIKDADGLIIRTDTPITKELLTFAKKLKVICRAGIGVDHVDLKTCSEKKIVVMNTPEANRISTAEHAFTLLLSLAKKVPQANQALHEGRWDQENFEGHEVAGKTLAIIGLGNIGQKVATMAQAFKMNVVASDPYLNPVVAASLNVPLHTLDVAVKAAHFVTFHVPLTDETKSFGNDNFFKLMRKEAFLINTSRGKVVDEKALFWALEKKQIQGAALDVFEDEPLPGSSPLLKINNLILTPHVAGKTKESQLKVSLDAAQQICGFFKSGKLINVVSSESL